MSKLQRIDLFADLPVQNRGMFGATFNSPNRNGLTVCINPDLDEHRRKQYAFHELAHVVMDGEQDIVVNDVYATMNGTISNSDLGLISDGFTVIEEAIAQEISEIFVYSSENRLRPNLNRTTDNAIPNITFYSNHDFYGLYQPLGIAFAKTLRGIGNKNDVSTSESIHLKLLCGRVFDGNFAKDILEEYTKDNHYVDLIKNFKDMGNVYRVKQSYSRVIQNFNMLRDQRPRRKDTDEPGGNH